MYATIYVCMYYMLPSILRKPQHGDLPDHEMRPICMHVCIYICMYVSHATFHSP